MNWLILTAIVLAAGDSGPTVRAGRAPAAPRIDGVLEPAWLAAEPARGFVQRYPDEGRPATDSTRVYLLSDDACLYVAFQCFARSDRLNLQVRPRDSRAGESVGLLLDSFDDKTGAYYFCVNARNVQYDSRITSDGMGWDNSWDGVWFSAARVTDYGYCVEIRIPFRAIQYRPGRNEWGINFDRYTPYNDEQSDWALNRHRMLRVSNCGRLQGIEPGSRGLNLEVYPFGLLGYTAGIGGASDRVRPDAGLDLAWFPGSATSLQLTVNPDFAQIEADPTQVSLGRYELSLSEQRPFFVEGADVFKLGPFGVNVFHTRRIGKPLPGGGAAPILGGLKYIGKPGRFELGALGAACRETTFARDSVWCDSLGRTGTIPRDTTTLSFYSAARVRRSFLRNSSIGVLLADKENRLMRNRAGGIDLALRLGDCRLESDLSLAEYRKDDVHKLAPAGRAMFAWQGSVFSVSAAYRNVARDFDVSAIGFVPVKRENVALNGGAQLSNLGVVRSLYPYLSVTAYRDNEDVRHRFYSAYATPGVSIDFVNNWGGGFDVTGSRDNEYVFDPDAPAPLDSVFSYRSASSSVWFYTDMSRPFSVSSYVWGTTRGYNYRRHYFAANASSTLDLTWRITPNVSLESGVENTIEFDTLSRVVEMNWIVRPAFRYSVTRDLHLRLSGEYVPASRTARGSALLSWNIAPKSWLYLVWNELHDTGKGLPVLDRNGAIKLRYLFYF
jgi:hypothetical protein